MKRLEEVVLLFIMLLLIVPVYVNASGSFEYNAGNNYAREYIKKGNFRTTHERYIKQTELSHFIEKNEYEKTLVNKRSYLFDGVEFWTSTGNASKHYIIDYKGTLQEASDTSKHSVKDVEYVKEDIKVRGTGTYSNPWIFDPMYEVIVTTDLRYGQIIDSDSPGVKTVFVSRGENAVMQLERKPGTGYRYITNDCNAEYSNGYLTIKNITRNITCKVVFGTGKFKVTLNGSSTGKIVSNFKDNFYKYNEDMDLRDIMTKINPPSKTGHEFLGYKYGSTTVVNADGTLNRVATSVIMEDVTLNPSYNIKNPTNVTISGGATKIYNSSDTTITCSTDSTYDSNTKLYYSFGYSTTDGGNPSDWTSVSESNTYKINKSLYFGSRYYSCRVYAKDVNTSIKTSTITSPVDSNILVKHKNAKITFDANGGSLSGPNPRYTRYGKTVLFTGENISSEAASSLPSASKKGHTFNGWYTAKSGGTKVLKTDCSLSGTAASGITDASKYILVSDKTLYAQYTPKTYTVSFDCNGGSGSVSSQTATYGEGFTLTSSKCTKTGYSQNGWKDQDGTVWTTSNTNNWTWTYTNNISLKAQWEPQTYKVTFDCNGGSGSVSSQTATYGEGFTLTSSKCGTKSGYKQYGWYDQNNVIWTTSNTNNWTWTYTSNRNLKANWKTDVCSAEVSLTGSYCGQYSNNFRSDDHFYGQGDCYTPGKPTLYNYWTEWYMSYCATEECKKYGYPIGTKMKKISDDNNCGWGVYWCSCE